MNPELFSLSQIEWQFFATLTFKQERLRDAVRLKMFFAWQRAQCKYGGIHFKQSLWVLRSERGEQGGRIHYHALSAGFPGWFCSDVTCFQAKNTWEDLGGGMARVFKYDGSLSGAAYVLKALNSEAVKIRNDKNFYEARKFGATCDLMLSKSLVTVLQGAVDRTDGADSTTQSGAGCERI